MHNLMLVWDARKATKHFADFIGRVQDVSRDFNAELTMCQFDHRVDPHSGRIAYGMRGLLDQIYAVKPHSILCFGSQSNVMGKLIKPALKIPLICNSLPDFIDPQQSKSSVFDRFTQKFSESFRWQPHHAQVDFVPTLPEKTHFQGHVLVIEEDPTKVVLNHLLQQHGLSGTTRTKSAVLSNIHQGFAGIDLLFMSSRADDDGRLILCANACGIPVVLLSQDTLSQHIRDGYNGWVVESTEDARMTRCLYNWNNMSVDAKRIVSRYTQEHQSNRNGLHHFFRTIGLDARTHTLQTRQHKIA